MSSEFGIRELLNAYRRGVFPMADSRDDPHLFLIDPDERGVLPLKGFHIPSRLARTVRQDHFEITVDRAFSRVMEGCAEASEGRETTWINSAIINLYGSLHRRGFAHSVECWEGEELVGGLYGVSIGAVFFGESMFSRARDASKVALVHLVARLIAGGYELLDAQFHNPHLEQFGLKCLKRDDFKVLLDDAIDKEGRFYSDEAPETGTAAVQLITQTS
ncbi:MAG: leucyl/phenylalanyl-tRNA--protein transferase [Pseudomonadota bacterium]